MTGYKQPTFICIYSYYTVNIKNVVHTIKTTIAKK